ncbi:MAG: hypothetical protein V1921_01545 [Candidatus Altiarchaeota archaeon]
MANCNDCGEKLSFFSSLTGGKLCDGCKSIYQSKLSNAEEEIFAKKNVTEQQLEILKKQEKKYLIKLYFRLFNHFEEDSEFDKAEIETLQKIQESFNLTNNEVRLDECLRPHIYVYGIREEGKLPTLDKLSILGASPVILKKGEVVHYAGSAILKEMRSVSLGYEGGSHGISFPIAKGVRYRVGSHRGHVRRETKLVETSSGALIVTNQRLLLHPGPGSKPVSIPLNKILSYNCYNNGIEVYKDGREKGYFFSMDKSGSVELFGVCLGYLLGQQSE